MTISQIGFFKGIGVVLLAALLSYLGDASNLTGIINNPFVITLVVGLASSLESYIKDKKGTAFFGAVSVK